MTRRMSLAERLLSLFIASTGAVLIAALATSWLGPCAYAEDCEGDLEWRATARDVYVDGEPHPDVRIWSAEDRLALFLPESLDALVIEAVETEEGGDELRLLSMPKTAWLASDPQTATSKRPEKTLEGRVYEVGGGLWIENGGRSYLIASHQGEAGDVELSQLWDRAPLWKDLHGAYEPDAAAVEAFGAEERELELTVAFGTWCGDSRRSVPRLLKALDAASNPRLTVKLVSIDRSFTDPLDFVRQEQVTNVPTVIVRESGREIGRFVERPRSPVVETDVAALLAGRPVAPDVYFDETDRLLGSGVLGLYDGAERVGEERWRLFETDEGGKRLHVRRSVGSGATETWMRLDELGRPAFAEVTRRGDMELSRTRLYVRSGQVSSTTRGDATGIVKQNLDWSPDSVLLAPGISGVGLTWMQAGRPKEHRNLPAYALASVDAGAPGRVEAAALGWLEGESSVETGAGSLDAVQLRFEHGERSGRYWLHPELEMPVSVELDDGRRFVLESLELGESPASTL